MSAIERALKANREAARGASVPSLLSNPQGGSGDSGDSGDSGGSVLASARKTKPASRPDIELDYDEQAVNDLVIQALANRGDVYNHNGSLAIVCRDAVDSTRRVIRRLPLPGVREFVSSTVEFITYSKDPQTGKTKRHVHRAPKWCFEAIHKRGHLPGIPPIKGIVTAPVLRSDGSILQQSGYDPGSGLFVELVDKFPEIPENPSGADVNRAVATLFDLVSDFPFRDDESRSAWLASLLTPLAREAFSGCTGPLFLIDANTRGSGKSLLADVNTLIVEGREATRLTSPKDDDECRKRITSLVNDSERVVLIDNISGKFGCASFDAALTGVVWKDRRLGSTELIEAPLRMTWYGSGNNVILAADTARRTCHIRLESPLENPEDRAGFKYGDIRAHVRKHRPELLTAALTILRGYISAGRPDIQLKPWGSFEGWSDLIRAAIVRAGLVDPGETRTELRQTSDSEAETLRAMLVALQHIDQDGHGLRTSDLMKIAGGKDQSYGSDGVEMIREAIEAFVESPIERANSRKLGNRLSHFRGRVINGLCFDFKTRQGNRFWFVRSGGSVGDFEKTQSHPSQPHKTQVFNNSGDSGDSLFYFSEEKEVFNTDCNAETHSVLGHGPKTEPPKPPKPHEEVDVSWIEGTSL